MFGGRRGPGAVRFGGVGGRVVILPLVLASLLFGGPGAVLVVPGAN